MKVNLLTLVACLLALLSISNARDIDSNDIGAGSSSSSSSSLDSNLRKALLKALSELESEATTEESNQSNKDKTKYIFTSSAGTPFQDRSVEKASASQVNIYAHEDKSQQKFETDTTATTKSEELLTSAAASNFGFSSTTKDNSLSSGVKDSNPSLESLIVTPKPKPIETTTVTTTTSTEESEAKVEDVQFFSAPLVAAFTVHQDERGLPKKVEPIYKEAGQKAVTVSQIEATQSAEGLRQEQERVRALEQEAFLQQSRKKEEEELLFKHQQLEHQRRLLKQQQEQFQKEQELVRQQQQTFANNNLINNNNNNNQFIPIVGNVDHMNSGRTAGGFGHGTFDGLGARSNVNPVNNHVSTFNGNQFNGANTQSAVSTGFTAQPFSTFSTANLNAVSFTTPKSTFVSAQPQNVVNSNLNQIVPSISFTPNANNFNNIAAANAFNSVPVNSFNAATSASFNSIPNTNIRPSGGTVVSFQQSISNPNEIVSQNLPLNAQILPVKSAVEFRNTPQFFQQNTVFQQNLPKQNTPTRIFRQEPQTFNFGLNKYQQPEYQPFNPPLTQNQFKQQVSSQFIPQAQPIVAPPHPNQNRFFRSNYESFQTTPFNNYQTFQQQPINQQLNNLLYHSGITRNVRQNEDLSIVSKVLSQNVGFDNGFRQQRYPFVKK